MVSLVSELEAAIARLDPGKRSQLAKVAASRLQQDWLPNVGPQMQAYLSDADVLLYGGAAGGGKTDLGLGLALTKHEKTVFFRRAFVDLQAAEDRLIEIIKTRDGYNGQKMMLRRGKRSIEFGALEKPNAEFSWQGRPHDLIIVDEGAQIPEDKISYVTGWNRSTSPGQRCRTVICSNPPTGAEGAWIMVWFAPWLDPLFANPARPGELRWAIRVDKTIVWVEGSGKYSPDGSVYSGEGKSYTALSYTFIPAMLDDNPYLRDTDYRSRVENMPEPLRSQLLYGDFLAGKKDHEWQVIPSSWVDAAFERGRNFPKTRLVMTSISADVALGGQDEAVIQALLNSFDDDWVFPEATYIPGVNVDDPSSIAVWMLKDRRDNADMSVDATGGWGSGVMSHLKTQHTLPCYGVVFSKGSKAVAADKVHTFKNLRAEMWWRFREALDPDGPYNVVFLAGKHEKKIKAQLTAPHYTVKGTDILVESKEDIRDRLGTSTDDADAKIMAWHRRKAGQMIATTEVPGLPKVPVVPTLPNTRDAWMLRGG